MSDGFLLRCIGAIDDHLINMSVKKIGKIKIERRIKFFSSIAAAILMMTAIPIGTMNHANLLPNSTVDDSPIIEMPVIEIGNDYYQVLNEKSCAKYGLPENPDSDLIKELIGTYDSVDKTMRVNVFTTTVSTTKNILIGECGGKFFYLVFCNKINGERFADAESFLDFFGYHSEADVVSLSINGKNINDKKTIEKFWNAISNSTISTPEDYDSTVYQSEWTYDKAQEKYNSLIDIELNVGLPSYLQIRYSSLVGFFVSHDCYLRIT
ncbi:MAG: hypothetical protein IKK42_03610 [Oscillospiraceae bacterium]|nr:hypothetical protein [Oscillospiraceae bacterium]